MKTDMSDGVAIEPLSASPMNLVELRDALHRGEHLSIASKYLDGRLPYDRSDWRQAALVGLAMRHHLDRAGHMGSSAIRFETEQLGDGLSITLEWPEDSAIDQALVTIELCDADGGVTRIEQAFVRVEEAEGVAARFRGRALASNQEVVLRPVREAVSVDVTVHPGHVLRFDAAVLPSTMRSTRAGQEARQQRRIAFKPAPDVPRSPIDIYREMQGHAGALELIDATEARADIRRQQTLARKNRRRRRTRTLFVTLLILGLLVSALEMLSRFGVPIPEWVPVSRSDVVPGDVPLTVTGSWERELGVSSSPSQRL